LSIRILTIVLMSTLAGGCAHHVRLQVPGTSPAARYTCTQTGGCKPLAVDDPAATNPSGTSFVNLPAECHGRFNDITIIDADSSEPHVLVTCAPPEEPIGDM
jgi:hypothetical protein